MRCWKCCLWWTLLHDLASMKYSWFITTTNSLRINIVWLQKNNWLKSALVSWVTECEYNLHVWGCGTMLCYDILCSIPATCFLEQLSLHQTCISKTENKMKWIRTSWYCYAGNHRNSNYKEIIKLNNCLKDFFLQIETGKTISEKANKTRRFQVSIQWPGVI